MIDKTTVTIAEIELGLTIIDNYILQAREILDASVYDAKKLRKILNSIKKTVTVAVKASSDDQ